ncbi:MAG: exodeoxyribonuclease I [bacterium]|nr:exodeoxyribonuclease I [bacterium]
MAQSFYFYDVETSGINPRTSRIMQFAGQRTDLGLKPIADPDNIYVKMTDDVLPEPDAILITGITPQKTLADGISESEFLKYFTNQIAIPGTIFVGFNNVRFDDEFIRFLHYRNFYDAYEWGWRDNRSRWDILDLVRMTRALRPDNIEWPFGSDGRPSNRLELLTAVNKLEHDDAHDALSDVSATIAVTRLIQNKQPKLFEFLLQLRDKKVVSKLVTTNQPFVYCSGKYPSVYEKTSVVVNIGEHPGKQGTLVYDLRTNPEEVVHLSPAELAVRWQERVEDETKRFPIKTLQFNRCPAVAPLGVLDQASQERVKIDMKLISQHHKTLKKYKDFHQHLLAALKIMDKKRQLDMMPDDQAVDTQLYEGFFAEQDKTAMSVVRAADKNDIGSLNITFSDPRLAHLLPLYKARNYSDVLSSEERETWEEFRTRKLLGGGDQSLAACFFARLANLAERVNTSAEEEFILQELQLYAQSILPLPDA